MDCKWVSAEQADDVGGAAVGFTKRCPFPSQDGFYRSRTRLAPRSCRNAWRYSSIKQRPRSSRLGESCLRSVLEELDLAPVATSRVAPGLDGRNEPARPGDRRLWRTRRNRKVQPGSAPGAVR